MKKIIRVIFGGLLTIVGIALFVFVLFTQLQHGWWVGGAGFAAFLVLLGVAILRDYRLQDVF